MMLLISDEVKLICKLYVDGKLVIVFPDKSVAFTNVPDPTLRNDRPADVVSTEGEVNNWMLKSDDKMLEGRLNVVLPRDTVQPVDV